MQLLLEGKTVFITGASSGIGRSTAIECAKAGAKLIIAGRDCNRLEGTVSEISKYSSEKPVIIDGDLNSEEFRAKLFDNISNGEVHGVALCAGMVTVTPVSFATEEKILDIFKTNFFSNVAIIRGMLKNKNLKRGASVVTVTSVLGLDGFMPGNAPYGASKAALESWIKNCALEYASKGIRFNTIHPGSINTPMLNLSSISKEQIENAIAKIPMKHMGEPEEIANPIIFMLSDASSFMTGTSIIVDGGQHLLF